MSTYKEIRAPKKEKRFYERSPTEHLWMGERKTGGDEAGRVSRRISDGNRMCPGSTAGRRAEASLLADVEGEGSIIRTKTG